MEGQKITWIAPHSIQQVLTEDVDFNVMLTFLEYYEVMVLQFLFSPSKSNNKLFSFFSAEYQKL